MTGAPAASIAATTVIVFSVSPDYFYGTVIIFSGLSILEFS